MNLFFERAIWQFSRFGRIIIYRGLGMETMDIDALFEKNARQLALSLGNAIDAALASNETLKNAEQRNNLAHIYISFLFSAVLCKQPWLRIDFYDEGNRANAAYSSTEWDAPEISGELYAEANTLAKRGGITKEYELERIWFDLSEGNYQAFERHLPEIIHECREAQELKCQWHFGQYLGGTKTIWGSENDEIL